jgi:hypothetical protein
MDQPADFAPFIDQLYALTASPFTCDELTAQCLSYGWMLENVLPSFERSFRLVDDLRLWVGDCDGLEPPCALLVARWYSEDDYPNLEEWRRDFDASFDLALTKTTAALGPPHVTGEYQHSYRKSEPPFRYGIWPGERALLILQQHDRDIQFGSEINVWLQPWTQGQPMPEFPLC